MRLSKQQLTGSKKIYYLSEQGNEPSSISSFLFIFSFLLSGACKGIWFVSSQGLSESTAYWKDKINLPE